jgi:very-short-patch-repair endonuclease
MKLVVEADGFGHLHQKQYDYERSIWLARRFGMKVVRFFNGDVMNGKAETRVREMLNF